MGRLRPRPVDGTLGPQLSACYVICTSLGVAAGCDALSRAGALNVGARQGAGFNEPARGTRAGRRCAGGRGREGGNVSSGKGARRCAHAGGEIEIGAGLSADGAEGGSGTAAWRGVALASGAWRPSLGGRWGQETGTEPVVRVVQQALAVQACAVRWVCRRIMSAHHSDSDSDSDSDAEGPPMRTAQSAPGSSCGGPATPVAASHTSTSQGLAATPRIPRRSGCESQGARRHNHISPSAVRGPQ